MYDVISNKNCGGGRDGGSGFARTTRIKTLACATSVNLVILFQAKTFFPDVQDLHINVGGSGVLILDQR